MFYFFFNFYQEYNDLDVEFKLLNESFLLDLNFGKQFNINTI